MIKLSKEGAYLLYGNKIVEETEELKETEAILKQELGKSLFQRKKLLKIQWHIGFWNNIIPLKIWKS